MGVYLLRSPRTYEHNEYNEYNEYNRNNKHNAIKSSAPLSELYSNAARRAGPHLALGTHLQHGNHNDDLPAVVYPAKAWVVPILAHRDTAAAAGLLRCAGPLAQHLPPRCHESTAAYARYHTWPQPSQVVARVLLCYWYCDVYGHSGLAQGYLQPERAGTGGASNCGL